MRDWGTGVHWWGWLLGFTATAIFVGLVIWAIVALVSWAHHDGNGPSGGGGPEPPRGAGPRQRDSHPQASARRDEAQASIPGPDPSRVCSAARGPGRVRSRVPRRGVCPALRGRGPE